jgi:hypothetical protein
MTLNVMAMQHAKPLDSLMYLSEGAQHAAPKIRVTAKLEQSVGLFGDPDQRLAVVGYPTRTPITDENELQ